MTDGVQIPPTVQINKMGDKLKAAMEKGSVAAAKAAEAPAAPPAPEPAKAPEPVKAVEAPKTTDKPAVPEFKAPEKPAVTPEKPATTQTQTQTQTQPDKPTKIPAEQFKILEKSRDDFREKFEAAQKHALELEAKLSAVPQISPDEIESIKKERDSFKALVEQVALEHTPEFKKAFTDKIKDLKAEVKDAVGAEQADKIAKILKMPSDQRDEQIEALAEELSSFKQAKLSRLITELQRTERERDTELAKSSENIGKLEEHRAERERQQTAQERKQLETAFDSELQRVAVLPEFQIVEGNEEHNAVVKTNRERAKSFLNSNSAADRARIAFWAAKGVASIETDVMKDALISKLQKQISEMQSANPNIRTTQSTTEKPRQVNAQQGELQTVSRFKQAMTQGIPTSE